MKLSKKLASIWRSKLWFLLPGMVGVGAFAVAPFLDVIWLSLSDGVQNYKIVVQNEAFLLAIKNTCRFIGVGIPLLLSLSFLVALGIYRSRWMRFLKSVYLLPMAVPTAVIVLIWKVFFHKAGLFSQMLALFGVNGVDWLAGDASFWVLVISYLWKNIGYTVVLWIAGMGGIPQQTIDAARVDGASERQCVFHIILPQLKPALYTITMLSFLNSFKVFREAYLVAGAYPPQSMYLLQHLFNNWFTGLDIEKMSAAAVLLAVFFAACSLILQKLWEKETVA